MLKRLPKILVLVLALSVLIIGQEPPDFSAIRSSSAKGKRPIIIIPGIMGSELVNKYSGEKVWFNLRRSKDDDLKLPISSSLSRSRDNLVPGDIMRSIKFLITAQDFYGGFIESLSKYGGYREASWDKPPKSLEDHFFVFPYDWRRDNVETAQILIRKIAAVKKATGEKDIKFDIVAHSMGGLVARYAAMYGSRDLTLQKPRPTWAGAAHINKINMFGTPNHGAADSFQVLLDGFGAIKGVNLPFVRDLSPVEVFTMPSLFQLLPHADFQLFYDEDLKPLKVNLYDYRTWEKYGWSIYGNDKATARLTEGEILRMERHLERVLLRAKRFHRALDAGFDGPVEFAAFGSDCSETPNGYLLLNNGGPKSWKVLSRPEPFENSKGKKMDITDVREVMMNPGDGRVPRSSLVSGLGKESEQHFECVSHDNLMGSKLFQRRLLGGLVITARPLNP